jgi:hypothetical protein
VYQERQFVKEQWAKINIDKKRSLYIEKDWFKKLHNYCNTGELQQNWILISKTLFEQNLSDVGFTNLTSMVQLQLLNLWLLKVMLSCINNGVTTIKCGHQTTRQLKMRDMVRWVVLHIVLYIRKGLHLENNQENLQSGMPGSSSETRGRFCDGLGSNTMVSYSVCFIIYLLHIHGSLSMI